MQRLEEYQTVGAKRLRCGYTTGTCAAAAARAAAELLLAGRQVPAVAMRTPAGVEALIDVEESASGDGWAECSVRKDAGDDPDVTDGVTVCARVEFCEAPGVTIEGGTGVGRVTRPGLDQPVGAAAINSVPRKMIEEQVTQVVKRTGSLDGEGAGFASHLANVTPNPNENLKGGKRTSPLPHPPARIGLLVTISIPEGVELAGKTFNPRLGIEGGISVIGTSGIVRPMSEEAIIDSIRLEMGQRCAEGVAGLVVVPGNYGADFARDSLLIPEEPVACSNFVGQALDEAVRLGLDWLLLVGHIGKMAKVAAGAMNTHSRVADGRMETIAALAGAEGASAAVVSAVLDAPTTDAALDILDDAGMLDAVMKRLAARIGYHVNNRTGGHPRVEAVVFSKVRGLLGKTAGTDGLIKMHVMGASPFMHKGEV